MRIEYLVIHKSIGKYNKGNKQVLQDNAREIVDFVTNFYVSQDAQEIISRIVKKVTGMTDDEMLMSRCIEKNSTYPANDDITESFIEYLSQVEENITENSNVKTVMSEVNAFDFNNINYN